MKSIHDLYRDLLVMNASIVPYVTDFKSNPYSYLKARYYMYFASILVYFIQDTTIHPNTITKIYVFMGFVSALFLSIPSPVANYFGIFLIFSKGILDWADGYFARIKNMTSLTGHILDVYGARINSLTFIIALGIYQYFYFGYNELFLASLFVYPFCYVTLLTKFSNQYILDSIPSDSYANEFIYDHGSSSIQKTYPKIYSFFVLFLDDRSRTVDFVLLLIVIEHQGGPALSWLFYVAVNIKWIALWCGSFIFSSRINTAEKVVASKSNKIKK